MRYTITKNRGVLCDGTPYVIDENKPLVLEFDGLPAGEYRLVLHKAKVGGLEWELRQKHSGDHAEIEAFRLRTGTWNVELHKIEDKKIVDKIICTPLRVESLSSRTTGMIAYPEIDDVLDRLANIEKQLDTIQDWIGLVAPMIHEHKVIL